MFSVIPIIWLFFMSMKFAKNISGYGTMTTFENDSWWIEKPVFIPLLESANNTLYNQTHCLFTTFAIGECCSIEDY
jgi:hypothetical protein